MLLFLCVINVILDYEIKFDKSTYIERFLLLAVLRVIRIQQIFRFSNLDHMNWQTDRTSISG